MAEFFVGLFFLTIFGVTAIEILQIMIGVSWQEILGNYIDEKRGVSQPPEHPSRRAQDPLEVWKAGEDY